MATDDDNPVDAVMTALRAKLEERSRAAREAATRLQQIAADYARAVDAALAAEVAKKCDLALPDPDQSPVDLARRLLELVNGLPELRNESSTARESAVVQTEGRSDSAELPPPNAPASFSELLTNSQPRDERPERHAQPHPDVVELVRDLREHDFAELPAPLFRALAEELAARARDLQERVVADPEEKLPHVFRVLTRCAYDRGIKNIFGLNRQHEGDWRQRAEAARERRLRLEAGEPDSLRHRLQIPDAIVDQVAEEVDDDEEDDDGERAWELPHLYARASEAAVVLFGGLSKAAKLDKLRRRVGFRVEWIETSPGSTGSTSVLERRIREGRVAAVVILEGLLGHKHYEPVIAAARQAAVPVAYGGRAGTASVKQALSEIDLALQEGPEEASRSNAS